MHRVCSHVKASYKWYDSRRFCVAVVRGIATDDTCRVPLQAATLFSTLASGEQRLVVLCGDACTGKTVAYRTLALALSSLCTQPAEHPFKPGTTVTACVEQFVASASPRVRRYLEPALARQTRRAAQSADGISSGPQHDSLGEGYSVAVCELSGARSSNLVAEISLLSHAIRRARREEAEEVPLSVWHAVQGLGWHTDEAPAQLDQLASAITTGVLQQHGGAATRSTNSGEAASVADVSLAAIACLAEVISLENASPATLASCAVVVAPACNDLWQHAFESELQRLLCARVVVDPTAATPESGLPAACASAVRRLLLQDGHVEALVRVVALGSDDGGAAATQMSSSLLRVFFTLLDLGAHTWWQPAAAAPIQALSCQHSPITVR